VELEEKHIPNSLGSDCLDYFSDRNYGEFNLGDDLTPQSHKVYILLNCEEKKESVE
jgi:hypothetical protein